MQMRIETREPTRIAYISGRGPYPIVLPQAFAKLCAFAGPRGLFARPGAVTLAVCYDDPDTTPPDQIRSEAAITVDDHFKPEADVQARLLPGGKYAVVTHLGPYSGLAAAWKEVCGTLIPQAGLQFRSGECFEIYLNDPNSVPPEQIRTDIYVPVD